MTATVPLQHYIDARLADLIRLVETIDAKNDKAVELALNGLTEATRVAMAAADAKGVQHNGLIEMMRGMMGRFITRETLVAFVAGLTPFVLFYFGWVGK